MSDIQRQVCVPEGQTPLNSKLHHHYLDVIKQGEMARDAGAGSPYHGHSLEHCLHAVGWVQRDLRLALDKRLEEIKRLRAREARLREALEKIASAPYPDTRFNGRGMLPDFDGFKPIARAALEEEEK